MLTAYVTVRDTRLRNASSVCLWKISDDQANFLAHLGSLVITHFTLTQAIELARKVEVKIPCKSHVTEYSKIQHRFQKLRVINWFDNTVEVDIIGYPSKMRTCLGGTTRKRTLPPPPQHVDVFNLTVWYWCRTLSKYSRKYNVQGLGGQTV